MASERQADWIQIRPDVLSGLIWFQTVCKGYQQTTLVGKEFINRKWVVWWYYGTLLKSTLTFSLVVKVFGNAWILKRIKCTLLCNYQNALLFNIWIFCNIWHSLKWNSGVLKYLWEGAGVWYHVASKLLHGCVFGCAINSLIYSCGLSSGTDRQTMQQRKNITLLVNWSFIQYLI